MKALFFATLCSSLCMHAMQQPSMQEPRLKEIQKLLNARRLLKWRIGQQASIKGSDSEDDALRLQAVYKQLALIDPYRIALADTGKIKKVS